MNRIQPCVESLRLPEKYLISGLQVRSEIALPGATSMEVDFDSRSPVITIERRYDPLEIVGPRIRSEYAEVGTDDILIRPIHGLALRVREGKEITFNQNSDITDRQVRLFLLGTAWGILCHQRGLLPLHASAVAVNGSVAVFAAPRGTGKSTLTAALAMRGYPLVADDVCVTELGQMGLPLVHPLPAKGIKLVGEAADKLGIVRGQRVDINNDKAKYYVKVPQVGSEASMPIAAYYVLCEPAKPFYQLEEINGSKLLATVAENTYRVEYIRYVRQVDKFFQQLSAVCNKIRAFAVMGRPDLSRNSNDLTGLEHHMCNITDGQFVGNQIDEV